MKDLFNLEFYINTIITITLLIGAFVIGWEMKIIAIVSTSFYVLIYSVLGIPLFLNYIEDRKIELEKFASNLQKHRIDS